MVSGILGIMLSVIMLNAFVASVAAPLLFLFVPIIPPNPLRKEFVANSSESRHLCFYSFVAKQTFQKLFGSTKADG